MEKETFINLLESTPVIRAKETIALKAIIDEFPYFQTARALYLKGLKNQDSFKYNNELKVTAAFTTDRTILFNYVTSLDTDLQQKEEAQPQITAEISQKKAIERDPEKEEVQLQKPFSFSSTENYSFNQWLQLAAKKTNC